MEDSLCAEIDIDQMVNLKPLPGPRNPDPSPAATPTGPWPRDRHD
jgi:hypothetical protein